MKLFKLFKNIWICLVLLTSLIGKAQDAPYVKDFVQNIIPPSPTAGTMSTYGNLPLNGSSGGASYNLPLYSISSGDISLPISLNYYSSGVQVDALAGVVGMDWNLSAGGAISRVVKDFPDELGNRWYPASPDWGNTSHEVMMKNLARESGFDGEQDWFSFNVNGISGSFYFDENLNVNLSSDSNVKITYNAFQSSPIRLQFTLTDDRGFKYVFGGSDAYIEKNTPLQGCSGEVLAYYDSAWFLKEIVSPTNNIISFTYTDNNFTYKTSNTFNASFSGACYYANNPENLTFSISNCIGQSAMQSKLISAISFKNNSLLFDYNINRIDGGGKSLKNIKVLAGSQQIKNINLTYYSYGPSSPPVNPFLNDATLYYRTFLKDIEIKGNTLSTETEKYTFEYYNAETLPIRLGYNKDKYGFYNGSNNTIAFSSTLQSSPLVPYINGVATTANTDVNAFYSFYGMLKKVVHPTKGYTEFAYEGNSDTRIVQVTTPPANYTFNLNKSYCNGADITFSKTWVSDGAPIKLSGNTMSNGNFGCATGNYTIEIKKDNVVITAPTFAYGTAYTTTSAACTNSFSNYAPICTTAGSTYTVTIKLSGGAAAGNFVLNYMQPVTSNVEQSYYGPGTRVKSVVDISEGKAYNKRLFYYNKLADIQSPNTTLEHFYEPVFYHDFTTYITACRMLSADGEDPTNAVGWTLYYDALRCSISSATSYSLSRQGVCYQAITEIIEKDGSKEGAIERIFLSSPDSPGQIISGHDIYEAPSSNYADLTKDKVAEETLYDKANNPNTKKTYHYTPLYTGYQTSTIVRKNFANAGDPEWSLPGYGLGTVITPFSNYSAFIYKNYYGVVKLDKITEQEYYSTGIVEKVITKNYGNAPHYQLQSENTTNSVGTSVQTTYKYANDLIGVEQAPYMQQLVDNYRVAEPVITKTYKAGSKLIEKHVKYSSSTATSNLLLPVEVYTNKGNSDINISTITDRKLQITKYDGNGNILEYKMENDIPVTIIWGYNNQYPILKAENASYSQLASYVSAFQTASNNGTLTQSSFATLRDNLPNAMINSFTYSPLLGATSISDSKGDIQTYIYDNEGKLKFVKDKFGNTISENTYHFKP